MDKIKKVPVADWIIVTSLLTTSYMRTLCHVISQVFPPKGTPVTSISPPWVWPMDMSDCNMAKGQQQQKKQ